MFCPIGHLLMPDVVRAFHNHSFSLMPSQWDEAADVTDEELEEHRLRNDMVGSAVVHFLRSNPTLSVCSHDGTELKISNDILFPKFNSVDPLAFEFIDTSGSGWTVDASADMSAIRTAIGSFNEEEDGVEPHVVKVMEMFQERRERIHKKLQKFDGWSVSIRADSLPADAAAYHDYLDPSLMMEDDEEAPKVGRPRKQEMARSGYDSVFPFGHGGTPWKVVASKVSKRVEDDISVSTLKRALRS